MPTRNPLNFRRLFRKYKLNRGALRAIDLRVNGVLKLREFSVLRRLAQTQGQLKQVIFSNKGSRDTIGVYNRIIAREGTIGNLSGIQQVQKDLAAQPFSDSLAPRPVDFETLPVSLKKPELDENQVRLPTKKDEKDARRQQRMLRGMQFENIEAINALRRNRQQLMADRTFLPVRKADLGQSNAQVINKIISAYESVPLGFRDKVGAFSARVRPSLGIDWRHPFSTWKGRPIHVVSEPIDFASYVLNRVQQIKQTKKRQVVVLGGLRGAGKTTSINKLKELFSENGLRVDTIEMDSYFRVKEECKAPGGWDNPRNSRLDRLARAIGDFKRGRKIVVPVGRVPRHGVIQTKEIDPAQVDVLLVEGIHGLEPQIAKQADLRGFFYIPPGLQEIRTLWRDLRGDKAKIMPPEYYLGLNMRVRPWHAAFILPRIRDAEILFEHKMSASDLKAIARFLEFDAVRTKELADAWGIELEAT